MAADKVHLLLVSDVDLILQDFRLFVGIARQDAFQSPVGVTKIGICFVIAPSAYHNLITVIVAAYRSHKIHPEALRCSPPVNFFAGGEHA